MITATDAERLRATVGGPSHAPLSAEVVDEARRMEALREARRRMDKENEEVCDE